MSLTDQAAVPASQAANQAANQVVAPAVVQASAQTPAQPAATANVVLVETPVTLYEVGSRLSAHLPSPNDATRMVLRLDPPALGQLTVVMQRDQTGLHVHVHTSAVLTAAQTSQLRDAAQAAAAAAGTDLAGFDTSTSQERHQRPDNETASEFGQPRHTRAYTAVPDDDATRTRTSTNRHQNRPSSDSTLLWL